MLIFGIAKYLGSFDKFGCESFHPYLLICLSRGSKNVLVFEPFVMIELVSNDNDDWNDVDKESSPYDDV